MVHRKVEEQIAEWTLEDRKSCRMNVTDKIRFENFFDKRNRMQYTRSVQHHSGGFPVDAKLQSNVQIPHGWTDCIYHVGPALDYRTIPERCLIARGAGVRQGRQTSSLRPWTL